MLYTWMIVSVIWEVGLAIEMEPFGVAVDKQNNTATVVNE